MIKAIEGYLRSKKTWNSGPDDMDVDAARSNVSPKERARARAKVRATSAKDSPTAKVKATERATSFRATRIRSQTASVSFVENVNILSKIAINAFAQ